MKPFTLKDAVAHMQKHPSAVSNAEIAVKATELLRRLKRTDTARGRVSRPLVSMIRRGKTPGRGHGHKGWAVWKVMHELGLIPRMPQEIATADTGPAPRTREQMYGQVSYWRQKYYAAQQRDDHAEEVKEVPMLTAPMLRYYGLERNPVFDEIQTERDVWWSEQHKEQESILVDAVENNRFVRIAGRRGAGKSLIAEIVKRKLVKRDDVIIVEPSATISRVLNEGHLITSVIQAIKVKVDGRSEIFSESQSPAKRALAMRYLLLQQKRANRKVALWIDESHELESGTFLALKRFLDELDGVGRRLLGVILVGQNPEAAYNPKARDLSEVTLRLQTFRLQPMNKEMPAYLKWKIERAGGKVSEIITPAALQAIAARCPFPLDANAFFAQVLIQVYAEKEKPIQRHHVEAAGPEMVEAEHEEVVG